MHLMTPAGAEALCHMGGAENLMVAKCQNQKQHHLSALKQKSFKHPLYWTSLQDHVTHAPCHAEAPEHSTAYNSMLIFDLKQIGSFAAFNEIIVLVCFSFYLQIIRKPRPLEQLFLQSNKEYYNLFARSLLDHSHSWDFRNSLGSLT